MDKPCIYSRKEDIPPGAQFIDAFERGLMELFYVNNPNLKKGMPEGEKPLRKFMLDNNHRDIWIYYPWNHKAVRCVPEDLYYKLRTARNKNIITEDEQIIYRNAKVGIAGLSVGSAILSALVMSGGPKVLKIADFDLIEITNLNRINAKLTDVGMNKTVVAARGVWELDPFAELHVWDSGVNKENLEDFILGEPKIDIFIDEMDSLSLKAMARFICKKARIPVLMATDNGDEVLLDIERFDLEPDRAIFHGLVNEEELMDIGKINYQEWLKLVSRIVGPEYLPDNMRKSLLAIGDTLSAIPQLGPTASMAGAAIAYLVRKIANKEDMRSGRYVISLEEKLSHVYGSAEHHKKEQ